MSGVSQKKNLLKQSQTYKDKQDEELKQKMKMASSDLNWYKNRRPHSRAGSTSSKNRKSMEKGKKTANKNNTEVKIELPKQKKNKIYHHLNQIRKMETMLPPVDRSKVIIKEFGTIVAFAVNTHVGTVRDYNEDRVSILLNAQQR